VGCNQVTPKSDRSCSATNENGTDASLCSIGVLPSLCVIFGPGCRIVVVRGSVCQCLFSSRLNDFGSWLRLFAHRLAIALSQHVVSFVHSRLRLMYLKKPRFRVSRLFLRMYNRHCQWIDCVYILSGVFVVLEFGFWSLTPRYWIALWPKMTRIAQLYDRFVYRTLHMFY